jgi:phi LC3 family holin
MLTINLKERFRNKTFLLAMIGAVVLLIQQLGFKDLIPSNYADIVNSILTLLTMIGIVVDTSTKGVSDQITTNITGQSVNKVETVQAEASTTAINSDVSENSQDYSSNTAPISSEKESETSDAAATQSSTLLDANTALQQENLDLKATITQIQSVVANNATTV